MSTLQTFRPLTLPRAASALLILSAVAGCASQTTVATAPTAKPVAPEERINSLALEQCIVQNGADRC